MEKVTDVSSFSEEDRKRIGEYVFHVFNLRDSAAEMVGEYATKHERAKQAELVAENAKLRETLGEARLLILRMQMYVLPTPQTQQLIKNVEDYLTTTTPKP